MFHTQVKSIKTDTKKKYSLLLKKKVRNILESNFFVRYLIHQTTTKHQNNDNSRKKLYWRIYQV